MSHVPQDTPRAQPGSRATSALTATQRALLEAGLLARMRELDQRLADHHEGASRAEHAHELLEQDADDASQHAMDREVDLGQSDREMRELDALGRALRRVHEPGYGLCMGCAAEIPFDRLKAEPQAERCVTCEAALETRQELMK
jgi:RNA polymerase-binding transcription factor DksA